jgi:hypothetical protein
VLNGFSLYWHPFHDLAARTADVGCRNSPDNFYISHNGQKDVTPAYVKQICAGCPIRAACLEYALDDNNEKPDTGSEQ